MVQHPSFTLDELQSAIAVVLRSEKSLETPQKQKPDWLTVEQLMDYLPQKPAKQTIYQWTSNNEIPFYKRGKSLLFRTDEINKWLESGKRKSSLDLAKITDTYLENKRLKTST